MRKNVPQRTHISKFFLGGMPPDPPKMGRYATASALSTLLETPLFQILEPLGGGVVRGHVFLRICDALTVCENIFAKFVVEQLKLQN